MQLVLYKEKNETIQVRNATLFVLGCLVFFIFINVLFFTYTIGRITLNQTLITYLLIFISLFILAKLIKEIYVSDFKKSIIYGVISVGVLSIRYHSLNSLLNEIYISFPLPYFQIFAIVYIPFYIELFFFVLLISMLLLMSGLHIFPVKRRTQIKRIQASVNKPNYQNKLRQVKKRIKLEILELSREREIIDLYQIAKSLGIAEYIVVETVVNMLQRKEITGGLKFNSVELRDQEDFKNFKSGLETVLPNKYNRIIAIKRETWLKREGEKVRKKILELDEIQDRIDLNNVAESCQVDLTLVESIIKEMILKKEIRGEFFHSTNTVAIQKEESMEEIDDLMKGYKKWEEKDNKLN